MPVKVFVSSTYIDLKDHRQRVITQLRRAGYHVDPMEDWTSDADEPRRFSLDRLDGCQACVLLVGFRRGFVPAGQTRSITQMEYDHAVDHGINVLPFLLNDGVTGWPDHYDDRTNDPQLKEWREYLGLHHGIEQFTAEPTSLDVLPAVSRWQARQHEREQMEAAGFTPAAPLQFDHITVGGDFILRGVTIQQYFGDTRHSDPTSRNRRAMIEKVWAIWITGVLQPSLPHDILLELGLTERPVMVTRTLDFYAQRPDLVDRGQAPGTPLVDVFDRLDRALLILGAPGAGKTTLLLTLARDLLQRAAQDADHPFPVVFPLSSWAQQRRPLAAWLVDALNEQYDIPRKIGQAWVESDQVLPLLDGLDEVAAEHRAACVEAINTFRQDHGLLPLVVCSRIADYEALGARLRLQGALVIQPLTSQQVEDYLTQVGQPVAAVHQALQEDPTLWELLNTPLMLTVVSLAYVGKPTETLHTYETLEVKRQHLFAAYVDRMFQRRGIITRYTLEQTIHWLAWLARQMTQYSQSTFYLELMQPDWLPRLQRWIPRQGISIVLWSALMISIMPMILTINHNGINIATTSTGLILFLVSGVLLGLLIHKKDIKSIEKVYWSWSHLKWSALHVRDFFCLTCITYIFIWELLLIFLIGTTSYMFFPLTSIFTILFLFIKGLSFRGIEEKSIPNQGIRRSAKNGLLVGIIVFMIITIVKSAIRLLLTSELFEPIPGMVTLLNEYSLASNHFEFLSRYHPVGILVSNYALVNMLLTSWGFLDLVLIGFCALIFGEYAFIQHVFLRFSLILNNFTPWHYISFLDYACDRIFLRKVGGGYIFSHRFLMEYFADLNPQLSRSEKEPTSVLEEKSKFVKRMIISCFLGIILLAEGLFIPEEFRIFPHSFEAFVAIIVISTLLFFIKGKKFIWIVLLSLLYISYAVYYNLPVFLRDPVEVIYFVNIFFLIFIYIRCKELYFIRFISILLILVNLLKMKISDFFNKISFSIILLMMVLILTDFFRRGASRDLEKIER